MGLGMYFSYLCLFTAFFYNLYLAPGARYALFPAKSGSSKKDDNRTVPRPKRENVICGGEDTVPNAAFSFFLVFLVSVLQWPLQ